MWIIKAFIKSCSIDSGNEKSPKCKVVHEKAHFRYLLPNTQLPSSVGRASEWWSGVSWKTLMRTIEIARVHEFQFIVGKELSHVCLSYFGFEIRWIHLISWIRQVLHEQCNLLSIDNNLFTHNVFNYPWIVQIYFALSMYNAILHSSYSWIMNCFMDNANEHFTYPWIVNSIIHVQLDKLV